VTLHSSGEQPPTNCYCKICDFFIAVRSFFHNILYWHCCTIFYLGSFNIQFIQFHQIHYKSKRPIGYRISRNTLYKTLHKNSIHKLTIIIWYISYMIDWFNWYDWSIHFHNCIGIWTSSWKYTHHSILYILHGKRIEHSFLRRQLSIVLCQKYWTVLTTQ